MNNDQYQKVENALLTKMELYKIVREHIVHEDNLNNHRMTWLLTSQSVLFVAYYLILRATLDEDASLSTMIKLFCLIMLNSMGLLFSNFVTAKIWAGSIALMQLREFWYSKYPEEGDASTNNVLNNNPHYIFDDLRIIPDKQFPDVNFNTGFFDKDSEYSKLWNLIRDFNRFLVTIQLSLFKKFYDKDRFIKSEKHGRAIVTPLSYTLVLVWRFSFLLTTTVFIYEIWNMSSKLDIVQTLYKQYQEVSRDEQPSNSLKEGKLRIDSLKKGEFLKEGKLRIDSLKGEKLRMDSLSRKK